MLHIHPLTSLDHPALQPYRTMRRCEEHRRAGIFVAEGEKCVRRLLESELEIVSLLLPEKWRALYQPLLDRRAAETFEVFVAPKAALEELTGFSMYQGVLGVGRIPRAWTLREALARTASPRLFVAVDGLTSADNLGSLARNAVALGAQALLVGETCSSPWLRKSVRVSMGALYQLPLVEPASLAAALRDLRLAGVRGVAAHPHTERHTLAQADLRGDCCLVFGSEGNGLSPEVLAACDEAVVIPMQNGVDSLNVGAAAAAFLYEAARQRGRG